MTRLKKRALFLAGALVFACACAISQTTSPTQTPLPALEDKTRIADQVATSVALTVTALPASISITDTPPPTRTSAPSLTPTLIPTVVPAATFTLLPPTKLVYSCSIINQRPRDDTIFRPNDKFDVKWTIVNTGAVKWEDDTYLVYQNGSKVMAADAVLLPRLKPGQQYDLVFDAVAPNEQERHVMVWAVVGPGKDGGTYWMCYPYIRIIVGK